MQIFLTVLNPMLVLFLCMAIGFILCKTKILPLDAGKVMAKLITWVFSPAITFYSMSIYCTVDNLMIGGSYIYVSAIGVVLALAIAIPLSFVFVRKKSYDRGVYQYALTFANSSYVGDPVVLALFGLEGLFWYKIACLPIQLVIYTWGISILVVKREGEKQNPLKTLLNAPMVATLVGIIVGLLGLGEVLIIKDGVNTFLGSTLDGLKSCFGPVAMLLAGFTVARFDIKKMLKNKRVYIATFLRLIVIPIVLISALYGVMLLSNILFDMKVDTFVLFMLFFALAAPLGLNTVIFPEAFGGDPSTGASMALVSHTLCVITIPIMFSLMCAVFGVPTQMIA